MAADLSKVSQFSTPNSIALRRSAISIDLTKTPQIEHFQGCLKLYAENVCLIQYVHSEFQLLETLF